MYALARILFRFLSILMLRRCLVTLISIVLRIATVHGQSRDNELRLLGGVTMGLSAARIESSSAPSFNNLPWASLALDLGGSMTHTNKWGIALIGKGNLSGFAYQLDQNEYNVYLSSKGVEARAWWLLPFSPKHGTFLRMAGGFGYSFISADGISFSNDQFSAMSSSNTRTIPFISPEIGLTNISNKHAFDIGLRYVRHLDRSAALTTVLTAGSGTTVGTATTDHFGLIFRFHFGFKRKGPPSIRMPSIAFQERRTDTLTTLISQRDRITLDLWDNAEYDGDTISVIWNGRPILSGHELTRKKKRLVIDVKQDVNTLLIIAHNEGRVSPNTASCEVRYGNGKEQLLIRTSKTTNSAVIIEREQRITGGMRRSMK